MTLVIKNMLPSDWQEALLSELSKPYIKDLESFLNSEYQGNEKIYPLKENLFRALNLVPLNKVKVLILGQDPYHGVDQANGLAFGVYQNVKSPPSLKNIFKEVESDFGISVDFNSDLEGWAQQGVLLLNTVLSVQAGKAFSHRNKGWEKLTGRIMEIVASRFEPVVFMLWGKPAQEKASLITKYPNNYILKSSHPSPLSAYRGFLGCKHFSKANEILNRSKLQAIVWTKS